MLFVLYVVSEVFCYERGYLRVVFLFCCGVLGRGGWL